MLFCIYLPVIFPALNGKNLTTITIPSGDNMVLTSRLFSLEISQDDVEKNACLEFDIRGNGEVSPELFVRYIGIIPPTSRKVSAGAAPDGVNKWSFHFKLGKQCRKKIQVKVILKTKKSQLLLVNNLMLEIKKENLKK